MVPPPGLTSVGGRLYPWGMDAKGVNGQVSFDGRTLTIAREGLAARMGHGAAEVSFLAADVVQVSVKPAGFATNGLVVFKLRHGDSFAGPDLSHPNSVIFKKAQWAQFEPLVAAVREAQAA